MKNKTQTIRKMVGYLNNPEEDGGFWLPNIQRPFVWNEEQICRLFDTILREYPISTLLVWKTTSSIRRRKFIDNWHPALKLSDFYVPEDERKKCLVLDGQQRLQSLFIGLCGSFSGRELHFDVLSGTAALPDDIKYRFAFLPAATASFPWVKFKELVFSQRRKRDGVQTLEQQAARALGYTEKDQIENNLDLLFSLLNATWDVADNRMEELLDKLNRHGFAFDRDFVLKTCLVLLNQGAQYEVAKFRKPGVREAIEAEWDTLSASIQAVADFVRGKTYIQCDKALPSYLALIPLIYVCHHFPAAWKSAKNVDTFLVRTLLAGAFGGIPDRLIDTLVKRFKELQGFDEPEGYAVIRSQGRSLEMTPERFFGMGYGSKTIHLIFNLWYPTFSHVPAYDNNLPQIDHIFAQSQLKAVKVKSPETGRPIMKYRDEARNQLANCMLLTRTENGSGGKSDMPPVDWFDGKDDAYLDLHLIPKDRALWTVDRYEDFMAERQRLIAQRFAWLLTSPAP